MKPIVRTIWHLDLDSFFVSAERLRHPHLRGRPVAVGGEGGRGVLASCSYEARKFGVRSAMPTFRAMKMCPTLIVVPGDHEYYGELSKKVFSLLEAFTPVWEAASIDEAYLDMTGTESLFGEPLVAAAKLRKIIFDTTGLTASIGMGTNRLVAKIVTDFCKPDNAHLVPHGTEAAFLAPLPVERLPGCGKVTQAWLRDRELKTIGQLQRYPVDVLEKHLGTFGKSLYDSAWGRGSVEFHEEAKTRSISRETTFEIDVDDVLELKRIVWGMATDLAQQLRSQNEFARAIRLKLRYPPFHTVTRSRVLESPTQNDQPLYAALIQLFDEHWESAAPLRLIGVGCVLGEGASERQLGLFENTTRDARREDLDHLKDKIRLKFGDKALGTGRDPR